LRRALTPWRREAGGPGIALVPTMGALHEGHLSLIREAKKRTPHVAVSIFVNPAQFAPHEDFAAYPRDLESDAAKLASVDASLIFAPEAGEIYPPGFATTIQVGGPAKGLESDFRPHFFSGVATVVAKLLIAALPDWAMFGEKDYQQLLVVRRLARDLGLSTEIVGCAIAREADGLAMSSRNAYLDPRERAIAAKLNIVLREAIAQFHRGDATAEIERAAAQALLRHGFDSVDYVAIRDAQTLEPFAGQAGAPRILAAAKIGRTRLIDNMAV
jgi:pantoate--beta-alanine ligase